MVLCVGDVDADQVPPPRAGDVDGPDSRVDDYGDRIYRLALRITGVKADAEAAVENALRTAAATAQTFTGESAFASWLYLRVAHAAHRTLRMRGHHVPQRALDDVVPPLDGDGRHFAPMDDWSDRIGEQALQAELGGILTAVIDALPADYRTALILHDVEGVSTPDIAEILGVDASAVKSHVHRERLFVRKRLSDYFS